MNKLNREMETLQSRLNDMALYEANVTYVKSQRDVPVLTGELKSTGRVFTKNKKVFIDGFTGGQKSDVKIGVVTYGNEGRKADGYYASYKEFGVGDGMDFSGDYKDQDIIDFAYLFENRRTRKRVNTKAKRYLLKNALLSKRNLERKIITLAKNL